MEETEHNLPSSELERSEAHTSRNGPESSPIPVAQESAPGSPNAETTYAKLIAKSRSRRATGPRTAHGKAIASGNATKAGFLSRAVVIQSGGWSESYPEYRRLLRRYARHFKPVGPLEEDLVELVVVALWRYRRFLRAEVGAILLHHNLLSESEVSAQYNTAVSEGPKTEPERNIAETLFREHEELMERRASIPHDYDMEGLRRYESSLIRIYFRALHELERLQRRRLGEVVPPPIEVEIGH